MSYRDKQKRIDYLKRYYETHDRSEYLRKYNQDHKVEHSLYNHQYYQEHREKLIARLAITHRERMRKYKIETLTYYGGGKLACIKCGCDNIEALTIDHINGDGWRDRKIRNVGNYIYQLLKGKHYPYGYQTLCMNCQFIKEIEEKEHRHNNHILARESMGQFKNHREQYMAEYRLSHKAQLEQYAEAYKLIRSRHYRELKERVLAYYGNGNCLCVKCGFSDIRALSIDHLNGGGNQHRRLAQGNSGGIWSYIWLRNNHYPEGYQTLCMNCQFIKKHDNKEYSNKGKE